MGYDLHITRKKQWSDEDGETISLMEWREFIARNQELSPYLDVSQEDQGKVALFGNQESALRWEDGEIIAKNADKKLISKMVAIAVSLNARVQGDDGEEYQSDGTPRPQISAQSAKKLSLWARIKLVWKAQQKAREIQKTAPPFKVGSRVRDNWGKFGTIIELNRLANHGFGSMTVRYEDGRESYYPIGLSSGLELDDERKR